MSAGPLLIFDCDGVLVDSEPIANRVLAELLTEAGIPTSTEQSSRRYTGRSLPGILEELEPQLDRKLHGEFIEQYRTRVFTGFRAELHPIEGVARALDRISATANAPRTCVASGSRPDRVELSLRLTGLFDRFEGRLFSAVEVERGKPHPDLFLYAARRMGADTSECIVIEDSVYGVRAGTAAGMVVLGFCSSVSESDPEALAAKGARVFREMEELPGLISEILALQDPHKRVESPHTG